LGTFDLPIGGYRKLMQWVRESWLLYPVYFMERWSPSLLIWGRRPLGGEGEAKRETRGYTALERVISEKSDGRVVAEIHRADHLRTDHAAANLPALLRMIAMAQARDIPVVMLRLPHHPTYVQHRSAEWEEQVQHMLARVRETARPEGILYLDWEERPEFRDEHFADGDHLNPRGVALLRELLNPLLLQMAGAGEKQERVSPEG
jgi:hypothetical protein